MNAMNPGGVHGQGGADLGHLGDVNLRLTVEIGAIRLTLRELVDLREGAVHVLDRRIDQPVDVLVNDRLVARGEIVAVEDRFGVRLTEIVGARP